MRLRSALATIVAMLLAPALVHADELYACKEHPGSVTVTFKPEVTLEELVTWAMGFTCHNFLYDPRYVNGKKIALIAPSKLAPGDAYELFESSLATMGLAIVRQGSAYKIVESQTAKKEELPIVTTASGARDQVVRMVIRPTYAKPEMMKTALDALRSDAGDIQVVGGMLLVTDYGSRVHDMATLAKLVDVQDGNAVYTLPLQRASAAKLAQELEPLLGMKFVVDERTNTLLFASTEAMYVRAKALVDKLDPELSTDSGASIHVYALGNAIAEEVAKTVSASIQNLPLEAKAQVIADPKSNKLIVTSSARDFLAIRDVIRQLDEPRRQVFIETVLLEVQVQDDLDIGASSHGGIPTSGGAVAFGGVQTAQLKSTDLKDSLAAATGLVGGIVGAPLANSQQLLGTSIPSYAVLFQALATKSNTNVIQTPSIIALDNELTTFKVGQNVPYKKGVVPVVPTSTSVTTTNIDRADLNLELDIKPHISIGDNVLLEIKHDSKELGDKDPELGPSWTTRGFETRVVVRDRETVVITGLTQERDVDSSSQVPILGDIPILGYFFKYHTKQKHRTNLLVLLTPYIIKDQLDLQAIQERKAREHDEFVASFRSLDHAKYIPDIDYRRKRGLVEEIHLAVDAENRE